LGDGPSIFVEKRKINRKAPKKKLRNSGSDRWMEKGAEKKYPDFRWGKSTKQLQFRCQRKKKVGNQNRQFSTNKIWLGGGEKGGGGENANLSLWV